MHSTVHFLARDIIHPRPAEVLYELYHKHSLQGEVIALTDDGREPDGFMVIRVRGLSEPVIVPTGRVETGPEPLERLPGGVRTWTERPTCGLTPSESNLELQ